MPRFLVPWFLVLPLLSLPAAGAEPRLLLTPDGVWHEMRVTNALDAGAGSLRAALEEANALCTGELPCRIDLDGVDGELRLASPLPPITATDLELGTVASFPESSKRFVIDGGLLTAGNGLEIRSLRGSVTLRRLTLRNFPANGLAVIDPGPTEEWGRRVELQLVSLTANERGLAIADPQAHVTVVAAEISGNSRSGVAAWQTRSLSIRESSIGLNGASGVFLAPGVLWASISSTTIAHHRDYGVAAASGSRVTLSDVTMAANGVLDVDLGLDGPTPNDLDDRDGVLNTPVLTEARYDAARDATFVKGRLASHGRLGWLFRITPYVGDAVNRFGIAANVVPLVFVAELQTYDGGPFEREFTIRIPGDHRGRQISAQTSVHQYNDFPPYASSELSSALEVQ